MVVAFAQVNHTRGVATVITAIRPKSVHDCGVVEGSLPSTITPYNRIEHSTGYSISAIDSERGY